MTKRIWLKQIRNEQKVTLMALAERVGVRHGHLHDIESGRRNPSVKLAKRIAEALNFSWMKFFEEAEEQTA